MWSRIAAVLVLVFVVACVAERNQPTAAPSTSLEPQTGTAVPGETPTSPDLVVVRALTEFARRPSAAALAAVPLADTVEVGLGDSIVSVRASGDLVRADAWMLRRAPFHGRVGPFSALELLASDPPIAVTVGPHPHCASPPVPAPAAFAAFRQVSVQPTGVDTCLLWWTVDLFVSPSGRIAAITLDLWDP
jgi:hypothetical protein